MNFLNTEVMFLTVTFRSLAYCITVVVKNSTRQNISSDLLISL